MSECPAGGERGPAVSGEAGNCPRHTADKGAATRPRVSRIQTVSPTEVCFRVMHGIIPAARRLNGEFSRSTLVGPESGL